MDTIQKTVIYKYKDRKESLFFTSDRRGQLNILTFLIIFGLETYYRNILDQNGVIYIGGLWTYAYGGVVLIMALIRNQAKKKVENIHKQHNNNVTESIHFTDEFLAVETAEYFYTKCYWETLTGFNETKNHLRIFLGDVEFFVAKKYFSPNELNQIRGFLQSKMNSSKPQI